jgi:hypothetical protein
MYAGAMTEATPTATPPTTRRIASTNNELASPEPIALIKNKIAASRIAYKRP